MASPTFSSMHNASLVVPLWINGEEKIGGTSFKVISPATGECCWSAASASEADALDAVKAAQGAFTSWSKTKPAHRAKILLSAAQFMEQNSAEYASYMATEMGAEVAVAQFFVLPLAIQMLKDIASRALSLTGAVPASQKEGRSCMVLKVPYGVTLGVVPWNAPYVFGVRSAATAIATGNTTILKASEHTPRCYWAVGKVFQEAGLPAGVLNIVTCPPSDAPAIVNCMIEHPAVKKVNFTGSAGVGKMVAKTCGMNLKPCLMELGGKNSAIVLDDAEIHKSVKACMAGSFLNAGQICMGTDRILVHEAIALQFLEALQKDLAETMNSESPLPHVVSAASKERLVGVVEDALSSGASVACGSEASRNMPGTAFIPTVLKDVARSSKIWKDETFGPMAAFATFSSDEEAISLANETDYGLSAAVFTTDLRRGLEIAKGIEAGAIHINDMTIHDEPTLPFGGVKSSGWGRFNANEGMEEFLVTKCITWDD